MITYEYELKLGHTHAQDILDFAVSNWIAEGQPESHQVCFLNEGATFHFTAPWFPRGDVRPIERIEFGREWATVRLLNPATGWDIVMTTSDFIKHGTLSRRW